MPIWLPSWCSPGLGLLLLIAAGGTAAAQDRGTLDSEAAAAAGEARRSENASQGIVRPQDRAGSPWRRARSATTPHGCLAGGVALPINGKTWQVMRLSRNRNWGHPNLVTFLERLAAKAPSIGWHGLLVGDMAQPRGGPMITGHWSHQVGLDADIWLTPMPDRELTREEREEMSATNIVADDWKDVDPKIWSEKYIALYKMVAQEPERRARAGQSGDQEGAVPRRQGRPLVAAQGAPGGRTQLSLPHPHRLSAGQSRVQGAAGRRRPTKAAARISTGGSPSGWKSRSRPSSRSRS